MKTAEFIELRDGFIPPEYIELILEIVRNGGLVIYPTETLYGLGGNAWDESVAERIFQLKGRKENQPLPLIISGLNMLYEVAESIPPEVKVLSQNFWPGPLTIVLKACDRIEKHILGGGNTVAVRVSSSPAAQELTEKCGIPIISTSANFSGESPFLTGKEAYEKWGERVDLVLDGGLIPDSLPSTVLDLTGSKPVIVREGAVPGSQIFQLLSIS